MFNFCRNKLQIRFAMALVWNRDSFQGCCREFSPALSSAFVSWIGRWWSLEMAHCWSAGYHLRLVALRLRQAARSSLKTFQEKWLNSLCPDVNEASAVTGDLTLFNKPRWLVFSSEAANEVSGRVGSSHDVSWLLVSTLPISPLWDEQWCRKRHRTTRVEFDLGLNLQASVWQPVIAEYSVSIVSCYVRCHWHYIRQDKYILFPIEHKAALSQRTGAVKATVSSLYYPHLCTKSVTEKINQKYLSTYLLQNHVTQKEGKKIFRRTTRKKLSCCILWWAYGRGSEWCWLLLAPVTGVFCAIWASEWNAPVCVILCAGR